jgi:subtilisin family serine protease
VTGIEPIQEPPPNTKWAIVEQEEFKPLPLKDGPIGQKVLYEAPFYKTPGGEEVGLSHLFYVKLKQEGDQPHLEALAREHRVAILGRNKFMPLWYTLGCYRQASGNALEVANKFYESERFSVSEPDFLVDFRLQCCGDQHFKRQWGCKNTGQSGGTVGADIRACDAWTHTTGNPDVIVAVLDQGIELNHPDLPNISAQSFDTTTGISPSQVRGEHGTACAGIIGAAQNNSALGVAGVAPGATLMSISNSLVLAPNVQQELANGLSWAWQNGAHVISNSWGHNALASSLIDDAITDALTQGRGGLGTVVVFAAGNANGSVMYPANSNPEILAVGAMSPCAERKNPSSCDGESWWGSCYGRELDVVAPGVLIPTTDLQGAFGYDSGDYTLNFNGTSSACPHVAGVAALVLSLNPLHTQQQVVECIERSAQKMGSYSYQTTPGRPHGTWHQEMGYGLVDALASCLCRAQQAEATESIAAATARTDQPPPARDPGQFETTDEELPADLGKMSLNARPRKVVVASNGSTFDLAENGMMHLRFDDDRVWTLRLDYLGSFGEIAVYKELTTEAWIWCFFPDGRIYFLAGDRAHAFDAKAKWFSRSP